MACKVEAQFGVPCKRICHRYWARHSASVTDPPQCLAVRNSERTSTVIAMNPDEAPQALRGFAEVLSMQSEQGSVEKLDSPPATS